MNHILEGDMIEMKTIGKEDVEEDQYKQKTKKKDMELKRSDVGER